ncbi:MAG: FMN-binding negative transcriptional regulator [Candidatus Sulfotelmatobacter sp.]
MYIPEHFRLRHDGDALAFMRANPFAILISTIDAGPFATHLPLSVDSQAGDDGQEPRLALRGHVAKANPHWRYLEAKPECLTIFHGPHSYISPSNYVARESVPTWNYAAVHVYGNARLFSTEKDLHAMLDELIQTFEPVYRQQWEDLSPKFRDNMLRQIVGFEITATKVEGKFKLSQNRIHQDQANVIASLEKSEDSALSGVARMMKEQGLGITGEAKKVNKKD